MTKIEMTKKLTKIFHWAYLALFMTILLAVCLTYCGNLMHLPLKIDEFDFKGIFAGIFMAALAIILYSVLNSKIKIDSRSINILYAVAASLMLTVQLFFVFKLKNVPFSDCGFIHNAACEYAKGADFSQAVTATAKHETYFWQFPNNWAMLILLSNYYKLIFALKGSISVYDAGLLNTAFIQIGLFFLYRCMRLIFNDNRKTAFGILLMLGYAPLYTYAAYCYTDSMSIPFVTAAVYLIIKAKRANSIKAFFGFTAAASTVIAVGYSVKGSLAVLLVASAIYFAANLPLKKWLSATAIMAAVLIAFSSGVKNYGINSGIATEKQLDDHQFPTVHWVMMGLKDEGGFDVDEHNFTKFQPDLETRKIKDKEVVKGRFHDMSAADMGKHLMKKIGFTWSDGTYYINHHLKKAQESSIKTLICHNKTVLLYFQSYHLMILIAMGLSIISGAFKGKSNSMAYVNLAVFGLTLFLLIWETRSRYLFNFIPLMLIMAANGIDFAALKLKTYCHSKLKISLSAQQRENI